MEMIPVSSTDLASIGYDIDTATLRVEFLKGGYYEYYAVPNEIFEGLLSASSKGKYFNEFIKKGGYSFAKL